METEANKEMGLEGFKRLFDLPDDVKNQIKDFKNKKTMIHIDFESFSEDKKKYKKLKFPSLNKEFDIEGTNSIEFEYMSKKFPYKNDICEKVLLFDEEKEREYLINIKRHHDNYGIISKDIENEEAYSLEIVFFFKDSIDSFGNIVLNNKKIESKENFQRTKRYNLINIDRNISIQLFDNYSDNKIGNLNKNELNDIFRSNNLLYNFIYGNNKKIGKIYYNKEEKEIEDFNEKEIELLKIINEIVPDEKIHPFDIQNSFKALKNEQNYIINKETEEQGNHLDDLNKKFKRIPFFLKYYDKNPSDEDIKIIRALSILNILLSFDYSEWGHYLYFLLNETQNIFQKKNYLNNKDKIMIFINYLSIIKLNPHGKQYKLESFYELNEDSYFVKSELFYREIISKLTDDSSLFFLYLQLDSGADLDYISANYFYKIKHISLTEIKMHFLTENFYPYFFTFWDDKKLLAWNDGKTQVKNYNVCIQIYGEYDYIGGKSLVDNTVKLTLIKFHEYAHTKFKGDYQLNISPRYLLIENLDYLDNKKKIEDESKIEDPDIIKFLGESGQAIDRYIFGDEMIINNIIYSRSKDLSQLLQITNYFSILGIKNF